MEKCEKFTIAIFDVLEFLGDQKIQNETFFVILKHCVNFSSKSRFVQRKGFLELWSTFSKLRMQIDLMHVISAISMKFANSSSVHFNCIDMQYYLKELLQVN